MEHSSVLWYASQAGHWVEALPIGNGRLGAMVFGGAPSERFQLNEESLWSGFPRDCDNPDAINHLPEVRKAVFDGDYLLADALCKKMQGPFTQSYQPMADLRIEFEHDGEITGYRRSLDLDTAVTETAYQVGDVAFIRQAFATAPDNAIILRLACDRPGALSFAVGLDSPLRYQIAGQNLTGFPNPVRSLLLTGKAPKQVDPSYLRSDNPVIYDDEGGEGMAFAVCLAVQSTRRPGHSRRRSAARVRRR